MAITVETTPNPRAMKFIVGADVGGTATYKDQAGADPNVAALFEIPGVMSVFMTADFVTVSRTDDVSWDHIVPAATEILASTFG